MVAAAAAGAAWLRFAKTSLAAHKFTAADTAVNELQRHEPTIDSGQEYAVCRSRMLRGNVECRLMAEAAKLSPKQKQRCCVD